MGWEGGVGWGGLQKVTMSVDALSVDAAVSSDLDDLPFCFSQLGRGATTSQYRGADVAPTADRTFFFKQTSKTLILKGEPLHFWTKSASVVSYAALSRVTSLV